MQDQIKRRALGAELLGTEAYYLKQIQRDRCAWPIAIECQLVSLAAMGFTCISQD